MVARGLFDKIRGRSWSDHDPTKVLVTLSIDNTFKYENLKNRFKFF